jgi:hypothetical protein
LAGGFCGLSFWCTFHTHTIVNSKTSKMCTTSSNKCKLL